MKEVFRAKIQPSKRTTMGRPLLLGLLIVGVLVALFIPFFLARTMMGSSAPTTSTQLAGAVPGSLVKVVCRVSSVSADNIITATFLTRNGDGSYSPTPKTLRVRWNPGQPVVMGSSQDVRPGAVLQVSGHVDDKGIIQSDQIVILTGAITVR
jgi:hypothetical protein